MNRKTYILYHGNCYDGFGAAFAAWLRFTNDATYIPVFYGQPMPEIENGSDVYILDFSYPREQLIELCGKCHKLVVLDHHHTAQKDLDGMVFGGGGSLVKFDMSKSGAVLAWEYFHGLTVPEFFLYLQDRDLWKFSLPMSREVSCALRSYPMDFKTWSDISGIVVFGQIHELPGIQIDQLKIEGRAAMRLTNMQVEIMAKNNREFIFDTAEAAIHPTGDPVGAIKDAEGWYHVPVANATVFFSEVGEKLLELYPDAKFAAYYLDRADGKRQWGLRSRPDFDCSVVAKAFGGGGHKQASGFTQDL